MYRAIPPKIAIASALCKNTENFSRGDFAPSSIRAVTNPGVRATPTVTDQLTMLLLFL
jgi:hypothetical protein